MFFSQKKPTTSLLPRTFVLQRCVAGHLDAQASHLALFSAPRFRRKDQEEETGRAFLEFFRRFCPRNQSNQKFEKKNVCIWRLSFFDFEIVRITKTRVLKIKHVDLYENYLGL